MALRFDTRSAFERYGRERSYRTEFIMAIYASFGGILAGYDAGLVSAIKQTPYWLYTFTSLNYVNDPKGVHQLSSYGDASLSSFYSLGLFLGCLVSPLFGELMGRRNGTLVSCLIFAIGVGIMLGGSTFGVFVVGRAICGGGLGIMSCLLSLYLAESSSQRVRGAVISSYQWTINAGAVLATLLGGAMSKWYNRGSYMIPIAIQFVWVIIFAIGMATLPESPRYLVKVGRNEDAAKSLSRLRRLPMEDVEILAELEDITTQLKIENNNNAVGYIACFRMGENRMLLRTFTGIFLSALQQLTGINSIFIGGLAFFVYAGITDPKLMFISTMLVYVGISIPAFWLIEGVGRRRLLLWGSLGLMLCQVLLGSLSLALPMLQQAGLVAFVYAFMAIYAASWGPVTLIITSEIFPLNLRARAISLSQATGVLWAWGIGRATPFIIGAKYGNLGVKNFFIWGSACIVGFIFTYFCVPETKRLSLEDIDRLYSSTSPIRSASYED